MKFVLQLLIDFYKYNYILYLSMGGTVQGLQQSTENSISKYCTKLDFVTETKSPMFGNFKIYKMQEKPYEYIMKKTYHGPYDNSLLEQKKQSFAKVPRNKNIVGFDMVQLKLVQQKCSKYMELSFLCRYYYFTLEEAILKKIKKQSRFPEEEVLYILRTLLSVYESLHQYDQQNTCVFRSSKIFLTPEGFLKFYPEINNWQKQYQEQDFHSSTSMFSFITENQVELNLNKCKEEGLHEQKIESQTNDLVDIGVILLCVLCNAKQSDYRVNESVKYEIIKFVFSSYSDPDNKTLQIFKRLLKGIFEQQWGIEQVKQELEIIEEKHQCKNGTRLKLVGAENEDNSEVTINDQYYDIKRKSRLKMLPKYQLIPRNIQCLTGRHSFNKI